MTDEDDTFEFQKKLERAGTFTFSGSGEIKRDEELEWIEPGLDAKEFNMDEVKSTVKVRGYDLEDPPRPEKGAEKKALSRADPTVDFKRNRDAYGIMCPTCKGSGKCTTCHGRGKVKIFFKCRTCNGTGKCQDCSRDIKVPCPQCGEFISEYSSTCRKCGLLLLCPVCSSPLPAMATRCLSCKTEFKCKYCGKPVPLHYSKRCPHCGRWNG